jgi:hypothetical protein
MNAPHLLLLAGLMLGAEPAKAEQARKAVDAYLKQNAAQGAKVEIVSDDALTQLFPKHQFATAFFRRFPVATRPPNGMTPSNVLAVPSEGEPQLMTGPDDLKAFFVKNLPAIKDDDTGKTLVRAWLRLSYEFAQDRFYRFSIPEKEILARADGDARAYSGKAVVEPTGGNKGEIAATLFVVKEKLDRVEEQRKVFPGMRPRCQSTKLLDPDPLVRLMAEDSLRIMGRAAKPYLDEQRAKAGPELQQAIDRIWQRIVEEDR